MGLRRSGGAVPRGLALVLSLSLAFVSACQTTAPASGLSSPPTSPAASVSNAPSPAAETTFERIKREGVVRVGFHSEPPFNFAASGKLTGASPEIMRAFLASVGVQNLEGVLTEFVALIPALEANRIDVIGAGMFIRPARCKEIIFGDPEYQLGEGFAVLKGNPKGLRSFKDVAAKKDARLGVVTGGAEAEYAQVAGVPADRVVLFPDGPTAIAGLQAGRVDAVAAVTISINDLITKSGDPNLELATLSEQPVDKNGATAIGYGGMGFRKEDTDFRDAYNAWLRDAKASGKLLSIMAPFGFTKAEIPPADITAEQLCAG